MVHKEKRVLLVPKVPEGCKDFRETLELHQTRVRKGQLEVKVEMDLLVFKDQLDVVVLWVL
jgi:hypothetical protein